MRGPAVLAWALVLAGCPEPEVIVEQRTAAEHGEVLFGDPSLSNATSNRLSCAHCHAATAKPGLPGGALAGVTKRTSFWGGQENTLLRAVNACRYYFMLADEPWEGTEPDAVFLYAYLESLEGDAEPVPFTIAEVVDPGAGDSARGATVYQQACATCHGQKSTGQGRLISNAPILPEDTIAAHPAPEYSEIDRRLVFVEKTRHGGFYGYGGAMPPFSSEVLSDEDLADLLTFLGVP